jgi:DNA (cytosine-5)-methyltransferase 1
MTYDAVDLFAGPGGWDVAARSLDLRTLGIEWDGAACETRRASGLPTLEGDVRQLMVDVLMLHWAPGLIGSPPCQTFSMAGGGAGRRALDTVRNLVRRMGRRETLDLSVFEDERTGLVLEPLRWALFAIDLCRPFEWLALEQVPAVLPVWESMADVLRTEGYSVAVGKLSAEEYGVPQTRVRAFLVARRNGEARLPAPTHRKYRKRTAQHEGDQSLQPWVSMAEALGWGMTARPSMTVTGGGAATGGAEPFGNGARQSMTRERDAGRWSPAYVVGNQVNATVRTADEPAPTVAFGHNAAAHKWAFERPATTIQGDARVGQPGHKCMTLNCHPGKGTTRQFDEGSLRITPEEAATLQSFPVDHVWKGTKTKIHQQIGNAIPPLLAHAVLKGLKT